LLSEQATPKPLRRVGIEFRRSYQRRLSDGFVARYLSGERVLDIGYRGGDTEAVPVTEKAIGIELDYPGYDGIHLPFPDFSQDAVLASHVLEHISPYEEVLKDWFRVLKIGGFLAIFVPHWYLYERRADLPSQWNGDHRRFYTPGRLLAEIEGALPPNSYRVRHLADNDDGFDYAVSVDAPPRGCYEIELVIERIARPTYTDEMVLAESELRMTGEMDRVIESAIWELIQEPSRESTLGNFIGSLGYFTPWHRVRQNILYKDNGKAITETELKNAVRHLLNYVQVDETSYLNRYPALREARAQGKLRDPTLHWREHGYFESRLPS
jgi:SAM-dependent methyltransferase